MTETSTSWRVRKPEPDEYGDWYAGYIALAPEGDIIDALDAQRESLVRTFRSVPSAWHGRRYEEGKWTPEELVGHVVDAERLFSYRAMMFAHGHAGVPLAGIDQDAMAAASGATERGLASLVQEFEHLRRANIALFDSFTESDFDTRGTASGAEFTVRSIVFMIYGHAKHHAEVLTRTTEGYA